MVPLTWSFENPMWPAKNVDKKEKQKKYPSKNLKQIPKIKEEVFDANATKLKKLKNEISHPAIKTDGNSKIKSNVTIKDSKIYGNSNTDITINWEKIPNDWNDW